MTKAQKQKKLLDALNEVGKLAAELGVERGHWFLVDLRGIAVKARNYWGLNSLPNLAKSNAAKLTGMEPCPMCGKFKRINDSCPHGCVDPAFEVGGAK